MSRIFKEFMLFLALISSVWGSLQHRSKRFLTFPPTAPTRVQIISGIGIPVDLELESVTIGYVFKAEFFLPENATNYLNILADPFDLTTRPITGRKRRFLEEQKPTEAPGNELDNDKGYDSDQNEKFEKHQVQAEIIESDTEPNDNENEAEHDEETSWFDEENFDRSSDPMALKGPQNLRTTRWTIYKGMAAIAESKGLSGKSCVLRSICESAHTPLDYSNGILGELIHIVMSPSTTRDELSDHGDLEYYRAERLGKEGAPCDRVFSECRTSILDQFTGIYRPIMNFISRIMT